jgi:hypothetical protein
MLDLNVVHQELYISLWIFMPERESRFVASVRCIFFFATGENNRNDAFQTCKFSMRVRPVLG